MDDARSTTELAPEALRRRTNAASLGFVTTAELPTPERLVGQDRAQEAITLALEIADPRYNLFAAGDAGVGRTAGVMRSVHEVAGAQLVKRDWVYVHRFEQPEEPLALELPAGKGRAFAHDIESFTLNSRRELRRAFAADVYTQRRTQLLGDIEAQHGKLLDDLQNSALKLGFVIQGTPSGLAILPYKMKEGAPVPTTENTDGIETYSQDEYNALPEGEQQRLQQAHDQVEAAIAQTLPQAHALEELARQRVRALDLEVADRAIARLAELLVASYAGSSAVGEFVRHLRADMVAHADVLRGDDENANQSQSGQATQGSQGNPSSQADGNGDSDAPVNSADDGDDDPATGDEADSSAGSSSGLGGIPIEDLRMRPALAALMRRYQVNPIISHNVGDTVPVVEETNPTYLNLIGRIEFGIRGGLPFTDHMMIKAGSLHRAAGGFLVVQARDLLRADRSWDAIKRMLRFGEITMESGADSPGTPPSATLRPQPIRTQIKVVLIGDRDTYAALLQLDPEFRQLFKVRADFDVDMPRTTENEQAYARVVGQVARQQGSPALTSDAVAAVIEEGSRWAEDQERLSSLMINVSDLALEGCYWAKKAGATTTTAAHIAKAIASREYRLGLFSDKLNDMIAQGTLMIATDGAVVGQVNGLSVITSGDYEFGKPSRITARISPGVGGVVDIERETQMSGPSHTKGVLTLSGYLAGRFAQHFPLTLSASLSFEQLYDEVDGDSASSTELYALLSALAHTPIRQAFAVTGSVNQRGEIQAIGGVNQKIEGFFAICKLRGLSGQQGVMIPRANVRNLMLRDEVINAVRAGQFHIHAVSTVDEGIALLTGIPMGQPDAEGRYLSGTIGDRVNQTLHDYSERVRKYGVASGLA